MFSLVDTRAWYVMANYRETELAHIAPGMEAELYVQTDPAYRFRGIVQGIGWAVNPEDQPIVPGVPKIERELNWVHIAPALPGAHSHRESRAGARLPRRRVGGVHRSGLARRPRYCAYAGEPVGGRRPSEMPAVEIASTPLPAAPLSERIPLIGFLRRELAPFPGRARGDAAHRDRLRARCWCSA